MMPRIVLDTSVLIAGLRSQNGASFRLLQLLGKEQFQTVISVPLVLEYESVIRRQARVIGLTYSDINDVLDYLCKISEHRKVYYLWRPFLRDPGDDSVLELAVEAEAGFIVTHNLKDFSGVEQFGINFVSPQAFLRKIGEIK
jgi:putative PIN family toxin of toxin-antitoxin system